ncbi:hypothetical protein SeMB42_g07810 [Synchytrium endobioticum]|uniref:Uncharacterized protein n=1 Tax=Synchytrium endobioticum TaxID=286115 RepID=A0A507BVF8_9FUNG|nr:hypothetical protein SeMB42_g07810 [Synchytrium endobioticum]
MYWSTPLSIAISSFVLLQLANGLALDSRHQLETIDTTKHAVGHHLAKRMLSPAEARSDAVVPRTTTPIDDEDCCSMRLNLFGASALFSVTAAILLVNILSQSPHPNSALVYSMILAIVAAVMSGIFGCYASSAARSISPPVSRAASPPVSAPVTPLRGLVASRPAYPHTAYGTHPSTAGDVENAPQLHTMEERRNIAAARVSQDWTRDDAAGTSGSFEIGQSSDQRTNSQSPLVDSAVDIHPYFNHDQYHTLQGFSTQGMSDDRSHSNPACCFGSAGTRSIDGNPVMYEEYDVYIASFPLQFIVCAVPDVTRYKVQGMNAAVLTNINMYLVEHTRFARTDIAGFASLYIELLTRKGEEKKSVAKASVFIQPQSSLCAKASRIMHGFRLPCCIAIASAVVLVQLASALTGGRIHQIETIDTTKHAGAHHLARRMYDPESVRRASPPYAFRKLQRSTSGDIAQLRSTDSKFFGISVLCGALIIGVFTAFLAVHGMSRASTLVDVFAGFALAMVVLIVAVMGLVFSGYYSGQGPRASAREIELGTVSSSALQAINLDPPASQIPLLYAGCHHGADAVATMFYQIGKYELWTQIKRLSCRFLGAECLGKMLTADITTIAPSKSLISTDSRSVSQLLQQMQDPHVELVMTDDDSEADETWNEIRLRGHPAQEFWPGSSSAHDSTLDDSTTSPRLSFSSWIPVPAGPAATHQRAGGGDRKGKSVLT